MVNMILLAVMLVSTSQCSLISSHRIKFDMNLQHKLERDIFSVMKNSNVSEAELVEGEGLFRTKCMENDAERAQQILNETYDAVDELQRCTEAHFNWTTIQEEIKSAPIGTLNTVFDNYCNRTSLVMQCVTRFMSIMQPCLNEGIHDSLNNIYSTSGAIVDLICRREADLIGLFFQDGGPECLHEKREAVYQCYADNLLAYIPDKLSAVPDFRFSSDECLGVKRFRLCTIRRLLTCNEPTAANLVSVISRVLWKNTPCSQLTEIASTSFEEDRSVHETVSSSSEEVSTEKRTVPLETTSSVPQNDTTDSVVTTSPGVFYNNSDYQTTTNNLQVESASTDVHSAASMSVHGVHSVSIHGVREATTAKYVRVEPGVYSAMKETVKNVHGFHSDRVYFLTSSRPTGDADAALTTSRPTADAGAALSTTWTTVMMLGSTLVFLAAVVVLVVYTRHMGLIVRAVQEVAQRGRARE